MKKILINAAPWQTRIAVTQDELLQNIYFEAHATHTLERCFFKGKVVTPGCWRRSKNSSSDAKATYEKSGHKSVFDEDLESFVLEDDVNPFGPQDGDTVRLIEEGSWNPGDRRSAFETIYYEFDRHDIRPDQLQVLNRNIGRIKDAAAQGKTVIIEGHACTAGGSASYNMTLSENRAKAVKKQLVKQGIPATKLKVVGRGSEMCKVIGGGQEQQAPNRRVEMYEIA